MVRISFLLALSALLSCKGGQKAAADRTVLVELQTGACFGFCPVVRLTVHNDGFVEYEGTRFAEIIGRDSFVLSADETKGLREQVLAANLWQYPDRIPSEVVDAPSATLSVYKAGQAKSVRGSIDRPEPLLRLESKIKDLAEAHGFQVKRGVNPNLPPPNSRSEVIVKLKPPVNAGNWIRQFTEFKFQLIRRLSAENIWIVAYDPKQVSETAVLELFKKSSDVLEVQTNRAVQDRQ
ncbi:MAG: hypothetical protein IT260_03720 [Saprospiraceae bacterium]|nr:hypothetical protein [Saprospiraceae bacterium]